LGQATLFPIDDLGLGRAPGTDPSTALKEMNMQQWFPSNIEELQMYFSEGKNGRVRAIPVKVEILFGS
jgi:hypothetical protein